MTLHAAGQTPRPLPVGLDTYLSANRMTRRMPTRPQLVLLITCLLVWTPLTLRADGPMSDSDSSSEPLNTGLSEDLEASGAEGKSDRPGNAQDSAPKTARFPATVDVPAPPADPQLSRPVLLPAAPGVTLAAVSPVVLVLPGEDPADLPGARRADRLRLAAARNETEQFFLLLRPEADLADVTVRFEPLSGPGELPADAWSCRRAVDVRVPNRSDWYGLVGTITGPVPDPLTPTDKPFAGPGGRTTLLLPQVAVPGNAQPGLYRGAIVLEHAGGPIATVPVELTVWPVTLPKYPTFQTLSHEMAQTPEVWRWLRDKGLTGLKYGAGGIKIRWNKKTQTLELDTTEYRKQLKVLLDEVSMPYVCLPPSLLSRKQGLSQNYLSTGYAVGSEKFWPVFEAYMKQMGDFYRSNGWADRVLFRVMDEIPERFHPTLIEVCRRAKIQFPEIKLTVTTNSMPDDLAEVLDVWIVPWHFFVTRPDDVTRWDRLREKGLELWAYKNSLYTLNAPWSLRSLRFYPSVLGKYGFRGNLWWALYLTRHGRHDLWAEAYPFVRSKARKKAHYGNGQLFYPPRESDPHWRSSLRWEAYRQGIEEYEMLALLARRVRAAENALSPGTAGGIFSADQQVRWWGSMLSRSFRLQSYRQDGAAIERFRQLLARELQAIVQEPLGLVDVQPAEAWASPTPTLHVRALARPDTAVYLNGQRMPGSGERAISWDNITLQPGRNVVSIHFLAPDGSSKTLYRQVEVIGPDGTTRLGGHLPKANK